ncbi:MAG: phosphoribosylformylglycinamidine synthase [Bacteroidales bacterium]
MVTFFQGPEKLLFIVQSKENLTVADVEKLDWLFGGAEKLPDTELKGRFVGPRREMITPWSTNAVEITQNMGINGIQRIEEFTRVEQDGALYDPMLQASYTTLNQDIFTIRKDPDPIYEIEDIEGYNAREGLALSAEEVAYLHEVSNLLGRRLTDSEIFGFSQVNSEHCRHKIFNGVFIIDGEEHEQTLFQLIKQTTKLNPNRVVSAYKDNCAFLKGPVIGIFAPETQDKPDFFALKQSESILSLKAETHNFPTTVEPFNGAATGSGGEIRDRIGGGKGAFPLAGTAVYITSYPRTGGGRAWEKHTPARKWLYQTPEEILIKASNGASDFGNKFGQPLICGSVLTFEHFEAGRKYGYDKVIMLAGGVGFGKAKDTEKDIPVKGDKIVLLGGDNYRIGMGGGAVSSVATGEYANAIELNAVQRSNPEMQKRVSNAIRALSEAENNPVISIHDHGAGGHLNCLSELVEATGGNIDISRLPVGDPTLSARELIGNESQERMGLVLHEKDIPLLQRISDRERAPMYVIGDVTGDMQFVFEDKASGKKPINLKLEYLFGKPPRTVITDQTEPAAFSELHTSREKMQEYLELVLQLEAVACKDWLTNKVDRSVTGRVAHQQTAGQLQLPLNNLGVVALDYAGFKGIATSVGHAPVAGLVDPAAGSVLSIAESLTNIVWAPIEENLRGISLSANWMWPSKNKGEDARLYAAVKAASDFALALGINIPTGKDSLSMTQKYPDGEMVLAPGTVIISAAGEVTDIRKVVGPVLKNKPGSSILYINFSEDELNLGGSSLAQVLNQLGTKTPTVQDACYFANAFNSIQDLIQQGEILAGHDISSGGMITTLLEMLFADNHTGMNLDLTGLGVSDSIRLLFSENPGVVIQVKDAVKVRAFLSARYVHCNVIGEMIPDRKLTIRNGKEDFSFDVDNLRNVWFRSSYLLDTKQCGPLLARERFDNLGKQELSFRFPANFKGKFTDYGLDPNRTSKSGIRAAIIREKGVNGDREMAWIMHLAGMDVKDVHMTDLMSGRETLEDLNMIVFVGGFSNSDVLGSAKGWAGGFRYNDTARKALERFYQRSDTLSLGVCNGCQLMVELDLLTPDHEKKPRMLHNASHKFESIFLNVDVKENKSVMLSGLSGSRLGIWVAHGEGRFSLPYPEDKYNVVLKYSFAGYPGNPNGSDFGIAGICSPDGRHLAMMPHLERATYPWNWPYYPENRKDDQLSPWVEAFVNAREWVKKHKS